MGSIPKPERTDFEEYNKLNLGMCLGLGGANTAVDSRGWAYSGAASQFDFINRRYFVGGTTYASESFFDAAGTGMSFDSHGLLPGASGYYRHALSKLGMTAADTAGTIVTSIYIVTAALATQDWVWAAATGTANDYHAVAHQTNPRLAGVTRASGATTVLTANYEHCGRHEICCRSCLERGQH